MMVLIRFIVLQITTLFLLLAYTAYYNPDKKPDFGLALSLQLINMAYGLLFTRHLFVDAYDGQ